MLMAHVVAFACEASFGGGQRLTAANTTRRAELETYVGYVLDAQVPANFVWDDPEDAARDWTASGPGADVGGYWVYFNEAAAPPDGNPANEQFRDQRISYMMGYVGQELGMYVDWFHPRALISNARRDAIEAAHTALAAYFTAT